MGQLFCEVVGVKYPVMQAQENLTLEQGVRASYLVQSLSIEELQRIVAIAKDVRFSDCETIVKQFDREADLYVVLEGKVAIKASNGDLIARIKPGGVFGEISLLDERPRSASVVSEAPTRLALIPASDLRGLMDESPEMAVKILRNLGATLCERLRSANLQIEALLLALE